jgi:hypothetical protein
MRGADYPCYSSSWLPVSGYLLVSLAEILWLENKATSASTVRDLYCPEERTYHRVAEDDWSLGSKQLHSLRCWYQVIVEHRLSSKLVNYYDVLYCRRLIVPRRQCRSGRGSCQTFALAAIAQVMAAESNYEAGTTRVSVAAPSCLWVY